MTITKHRNGARRTVRVAYQSSVREWLSLLRASEITFIQLLERNFYEEFGLTPTESEKKAWRESLCRRLSHVVELADIPDAHVFVELGMPMSSARCDALLTAGRNGKRSTLIIELKQWDRMESGPYPGTVLVGGVLHDSPDVQAGQYAQYLQSLHPFFQSGLLRYCAYLHNMPGTRAGAVAAEQCFFAEDDERLAAWVRDLLPEPAAATCSADVLEAALALNPLLLADAAAAIRSARDESGKQIWTLLDGQAIPIAAALADVGKPGKRLIIQEGGPGTGKSIIAMNLLAEAAHRGLQVNHISGLKAFRNTLGGSIISGRSGLTTAQIQALFKLFHSFTRAQGETLDLAVCDEAHRARAKTTLRPYIVSNTPQAVEVMQAARVTVALLDEKQVLRTGEDGTVANWIAWGREAGIAREHITVLPPLQSHFRAGGSEAYVKWVDSLLYGTPTLWPGTKQFALRVVEDPGVLETSLQERANAGFSVRLVAGFCWPWSETKRDQPLALDVQIDGWRKAWNAQVPSGDSDPPWQRHPYTLWATRREDPLAEIGCIHSAQGFEFDYVGVIWGDDLVWDGHNWRPCPSASRDSDIRRYTNRRDLEQCLRLLRNSYRVLLTRGLKGCFIYCTNEKTQALVKRFTSG